MKHLSIGSAIASFLAGVCVFSAPAPGQDIHISKAGSGKKVTISVDGFGGGREGRLLVDTLQKDLERSGWFRVTVPSSATYRVLGESTESGGRLTVEARLAHTGSRQIELSRRYDGDSREARRLAHYLADDIVTKVKGCPGIASTRILLVGSRNGRKDLYLADYDGHNLAQITRDGAPCLSPSWGVESGEVFYTSLFGGFPDVYRIDLQSRKRTRVARHPGLNTGGVVSPDGRKMALILSRDGNPELYVQQLPAGRLTRLTRTTHAAEASPSWSPDGNEIVYVADTSGSPQLYILSARGGEARRVTFRGSENVSPDWGRNGDIAFCSRRGGRYHICRLDSRGAVEQLTDGSADHEEPSWAPDGRHIAYVRSVGYRSSVYILDTMGDPDVALLSLPGDWYSPAWSRVPWR